MGGGDGGDRYDQHSARAVTKCPSLQYASAAKEITRQGKRQYKTEYEYECDQRRRPRRRRQSLKLRNQIPTSTNRQSFNEMMIMVMVMTWPPGSLRDDESRPCARAPPEDKREKKWRVGHRLHHYLLCSRFGGKGGKDMLGLFNIIERSLSLSFFSPFFFLLDFVLQ